MFCTKCGAQLAEGQRFCTNCGTMVNAGAANGEVSVPRPEPTPEQPVYQQPVYQQPAPEKKAGRKQRAPKPPRPPKKGKALGWIIALVVVAALAALAVLNLNTVKNLADRTFSSPEAYYQHVETRAVSQLTDALEAENGVFEVYSKALDAEEERQFFEEEMTLSFDRKVVGEELMGLIEDEAGIDLSWLKSVGLYISGGKQDELIGGQMIALLNDTEIVGAYFAVDAEGGKFYASVPELSGQYMMVSADDLNMNGSMVSAEELMEALPDEDVLARIVDRYSALVIKNLNKVEKDSEKVTIDDVSATYTTLTVKIDAKTMLRIAKEVLAELHDDRDVEDLFCACLKAAGKSESEIDQAFFAFLDQIEQAQEQVDNTEPADIPVTINMTVYVDAAGRIRGRDVKVRQDKELKAQLSYLWVVKGTKFGVKAEVLSVNGYGSKGDSYYYSNTQDIIVSGGGQVSLKRELSGSLDLRYKMESDYNGDTDKRDMKLAKIDFSAALQSKSLSYEINVNPGKDLVEELLDSTGSMPAAVEDFIRSAGLSLRGEFAEKNGTAEIVLRSGKKDAAKLSIKATEIKPYDIDRPRSPVDPQTWAMGLDLSKISGIVGHLRDAGVPASLLEGLEYLF